MAAVQAIIIDPNQLFSTSYYDLGCQLKTSPRTVLRLFLQAVTDSDWAKTLSSDERRERNKKLSLVLPEHTPYDCLDIFRSIFRDLEVPSSEDNFLLQMWMVNRGLVLQNLRYGFERIYNSEPDSNTQLYLFAVQQEYQHSDSSKYLRLLLKEGIKLSSDLRGKDLLDIVSTNGGEEDLQLTLDYYKLQLGSKFRGFLSRRFEQLLHLNLSYPQNLLTLIHAGKKARLEPEEWLSRIDWIKHPEGFPQVMRYLGRSQKQAFFHAHGLNFLLGSAIQDERSFKQWIARMRETGVKPQDFFPPREGDKLNPIEKMLLMLGYRDACVRIVNEFGGEKACEIEIPDSQEYYASYYKEAAYINLRNIYGTIKEGMKLSSPRLKARYYSMEARKIWNDKVYLTFVDKFLSAAFLDTAHILRDAFENSGGDPHQMEKLLNALADDGPQYAHRFFYRSFVDIYHKARGHCCSIPQFFALPQLSREDEKSYFTPGNKKYHWRQMYNTLYFIFQPHALENLRKAYYDYIKPDLDYRLEEGAERRIGFPTSKPMILNGND